jgi:hypothetical protein
MNGSFTLNCSQAGVGFGASKSVPSLAIQGGIFDCIAASVCFSATSVTIGNGSTVVITGQQSVVTSSGWDISSQATLNFEYLSGSSVEANLTGLALIHAGSVLLPYSGLYALRIERLDGSGDVREIVFNGTRASGCAFSVGSVGSYAIYFESVLPGVIGRLHHIEIFSFDAAVLGDNFFSVANYRLLATMASGTPPVTEPASVAVTLSVTKTIPSTRPQTPTATRSVSASAIVWTAIATSSDPAWRRPSRVIPLIVAILSGIVLVAYHPVEWMIARRPALRPKPAAF